MATNRTRNTFRRHALATAVVLALAGTAHAQISTSTIKGQITSDTAVQPGLAVTAVNQANGNTYRTTTLADGTYVLPGLAPGSYEIRVAGPGATVKTQVITVTVGETAAVNLALVGTATQLERVIVTGTAERQGVRDSQVGTNVSQKMIESLPQVTHNFLSSADLAPGVAFVSDAGGNTHIQAGAQNFDHVNVFIDGVGTKNNVLRGGITGQDSSRGNPFPQSAIAEYRVLTQNYKAEYDQVSSAAISAVTKSGTNEFHGEAYGDRTGTNWRSKTPFEKENEAAGVSLPPSKKYEYGVSLGGPIIRDQVHFFMAYDGKDIEDSRSVVPRNLNLLPAGAGIVPSLIGSQGSTVEKFTEHLFFGKVDAQLSDDQKLTGSFLVRRETDHLPEDRNLSAPGNVKDRSNDETRFDLKHEWAIGPWLSEARVGYEDATWNPHSASTTPFIHYKVSNNLTNQTLNDSQDVLFAGGSPDAQKRGQKGTSISEDLTFTGLAGHTFKGGVGLKDMKYDLSGTAFSVDTVDTLIDRVTGQPYYNGTVCTGTNVTNGGLNSDQCRISRAIPGASVSFKNQQVGLYIQDDWAISKRLEANLGVRWDVESNMLNNDYVTPADRVAALHGLDTVRFGITPAAGQTYAQSLAKGGINVDDFIANGNGRKVYKGAVAPRLGGSYDVFGDRETVIFTGFGRSYDRTMANHALDELQKNQQPGGEVWLIHNDFKMPYADQFTLGVRQGFGRWNAEVALSEVYAKNQFVWFSGNRDPNGGFATQSPIDPLFGGPNGYGSLIMGDFVGKTKTNSLYGKLEKPYSASSHWGVNVAYTYADAKTTHREWNNDIFDFTYGKPGQGGFHPTTLVDKHRLVGAGVIDMPWGITLAAKATWASGYPRRVVDCSKGFTTCVTVEGDAPSYRQVDVGLSKELAFGIHRISVRLDALNVFDTINYGGFDDFGGGPVAAGNPSNSIGGDNLNLGKPNSIRGDPRTFRLALSYRF
jgi:outer membrane receptor protein involved in Fe transport